MRETETAEEKKARRQAIKDKIVTILGGLILLSLIVSFILTMVLKQETKTLNKITDKELLMYEQNSTIALEVQKIYQCYDETSYQKAREGIKFSQSLYSKYFGYEHYGKTASSYEAPRVTVLGLQYDYPCKEKGVYEYLIELEVYNAETGRSQYPVLIVQVQNSEVVKIQQY